MYIINIFDGSGAISSNFLRIYRGTSLYFFRVNMYNT